MIQRGWYDRDFIRDWSNGPLLVRSDTGRLLRRAIWSQAGIHAGPSPGMREARCPGIRPRQRSLSGRRSIAGPRGRLPHRCGKRSDQLPAGLRSLCLPVPKVFARGGRGDVLDSAKDLEEAARLIWHARPVSYYAWSGHEQHANTTENARAIALLYALTGCFDAPGGNVLFPSVPSAPVTGRALRRPAACCRHRCRRTPARAGALEPCLRPRFLSSRPRRRPYRYAGSSALAPICCLPRPIPCADAPPCPPWNSTPMPISS